MSTQALTQIRWVKNERRGVPLMRGGPEEALSFKEAAAQAFKAGDLVYQTGGKIAAVTTGGANTTVDSQIAGVTMKDASGVTDRDCYLLAITPEDVFEGNVYHGTLGNAVSALTQLGQTYALRKVNGRFHVDIETAIEGAADSLGRVKVIGFVDRIGDTYGRVLFQFVPYSAASDGSPAQRVLQLA